MKRTLIALLGIALFVAGCGNPQSAQLSTNFSSVGGGSNALALCNQFGVSNLVTGRVEHPSGGSNTENYLNVFLTQLDSSFYSNSANSISFYRMAVSTTGSSLDPNPLPISLITGGFVGVALSPAQVQAAGSPKFQLSGTDVSYNVIQVAVKIYGSSGLPATTTGNFLIPAFYADPLTFQAVPSHPASLTALHPFYSYIGQNLDFASMANAFCF